MSNTLIFKKDFSIAKISSVYYSYIYYSYAIGVDNISHDKFNKKINDEIDLINRKVLNNNYKFSKYKLKLICKGQGKAPRDLYIPTIRDRIVLKILQLFLAKAYADEIKQDTPQNIIKSIKAEINTGKYDSYIKIDIKNFYPSINKDILLRKVRCKIRSKDISNLLFDAMGGDTLNGVPQGLSISNILAYIYLQNLDLKLRKETGISYYRFVDDIFILLDKKDKDITISLLSLEFKKLKLEIHEIKVENSKSKFSEISKGFDYLGYRYLDEKFTVRDSTVNTLRNSIVECFTSYKYASSARKNIEFLIWRLNLKITGCIENEQPKGWLFFFAQITDKKILHELDYFINKLWKNFHLPVEDFKRVKKFSRTYYEITHKFYESNYIPNYDKYNEQQKIDFLENVHKFNTKNQSKEEIDYQFKKKIKKQVRKLLEDISKVS